MNATHRSDASEPIELDIAAIRSEVVRRVESGHPTIAAEMRVLLATSIEELDGDQRLIEMLQASIESNLSTIFHMLSNDIDLQSLKPPTAAIEYAIRLAQRNIPLAALTRGYYLAQSLFLRVALDEVERLELPAEVRIEAVRSVTNPVHSYIDWMLQRITEEHGAEHRRWWSARATMNTAVILKVLRGEAISERTFATDTRYDITQRHLALVAWHEETSGGVEAQQQLEQVVRQVAVQFGSPYPPLMSAADTTTTWSWVAMPSISPDPQARAAIERIVASAAGVRLAVGRPAEGVEGFRRSHEQAMAARRVALAAGKHRASPVVADADPNVALASLLLKDPTASAAWMRDVLGPFAGPGAANEAMRETLRVYYASGENASRAAELAGVHRNTVRHRVAKFQAERGGLRPVDPLEVALALRMHDTLERFG